MLIVAGPVGASEHDGGSHPERPARVGAVLAGIDDLHLGSDLITVDARPATRDDLLRVHDAQYVDELEAFSRRGGGSLDPDTYVTDTSWDAARRAAGAGIAAVDALGARGEGVAFVVVRPPGHHAEGARGMGFCLLNNVAVTAAALTARGERVVVVDWDVHHGNGTQEIFWDDPAVLYVSTHQWPLYPGTGRPEEVGGPGAIGATLNVPLPPGATGDVLLQVMDDVVAPAVEAFRADWVLVSCGYDAHRDDPLAELMLSSADFGALARRVAQFVPSPGRLVLFLEGGYDLQALRRSTAATLGALMGDPAEPEAPTFGGPGGDAVRSAARDRKRALDEASDRLHALGSLDAPVTVRRRDESGGAP
ncbi:MAG TPA: histone deacetylase [Acidimicrobiales bacterium]|nr:histone deacetylase [Acidimicrobiales bacterium]